MAEKLSISAFGRLAGCSRQNIHSLVGKNELIKDSDGKMDPDNPVNAEYLASRKISKRVVTNKWGAKPGNKPSPAKKKSTKKSQAKKKEKIIAPPPPKPPKALPPPTDPEDSDEEKEKNKAAATSRAIRKSIAELKKAEEQAEKARIDNEKARGKLCEVDTLGKTLIGYVIALHKTLLDQPRSFVDEFESAMKMGKSKTELTDILRKPASDSIMETKEIILKEIKKYKRAVVEAEKRRKAMEELLIDES